MKNIIYVLLGVAFIALSAQVTIDVPINNGGIPISGQSFAVLLVAYILGNQWGSWAAILYLIAGAAGLPVFADGESGLHVLAGSSAGFLYGFVIAASIVGYLGDIGWGRSFLKSLLAMFIGTAIIIAMGLVKLTLMYDFSKALEYGFYPYWQGAIVKIIVGATIVPLYYFIFKRNKNAHTPA